MAGLGGLVQKAFYLGVGVASYAGERASGTVKDLQEQAQKLVNELVERGEMTTDEAQQLFNKMMQRPQTSDPASSPAETESPRPRRIAILEEDVDSSTDMEAEKLRQQVASLKDQLESLKKHDN